MSSVADVLRAEQRRRVRAMPPDERLRLAFELGEADLAAFAAFRGVDRATALRLVRRYRQAGRRPCRCLETAP